MTKLIRHYFYDTSGAVTVDWVVLTAAVVGIGVAATLSVADGSVEMGGKISTFLEEDPRFVQNR